MMGRRYHYFGDSIEYHNSSSPIFSLIITRADIPAEIVPRETRADPIKIGFSCSLSHFNFFGVRFGPVTENERIVASSIVGRIMESNADLLGHITIIQR